MERAYQIEKKAIINLVKKLVSQIEGIYSLKRSLFGRSIKIKESEEGMEISLAIITKQGSSVPQIVQETQKKLKDEIEKTLGSPVKKVDVVVKGIKFSPKAKGK